MKAHDREPGDGGGSTASLVVPPLVTILLLAGVLCALDLTGVLDLIWDKEALQDRVRRAGVWAPLAYIGIIILRPFTLVPSVLLAPVAFALFGWYQGTALKVCGETVGATLAFLTARYGFSRAIGGALRRFLPRLARTMEGGFVDRLNGVLERRSGRAVLALRLNLLLPYDALNYGLGLTRLRLLPYILGTFVGIIPGAFLYIGLAGSALEGDWPRIALTIGGLALMIWLSVPVAREIVRGPDPRQAAPRD